MDDYTYDFDDYSYDFYEEEDILDLLESFNDYDEYVED